jgi:uncharacterized membrane protein YccC
MQERRPNGPDAISPKQVAVHFAMGALVGAIGALLLVLGNTDRIQQLFGPEAESPAVIAMFVAISAVTIAIGASLTGLIFSAIEAEEIAESKRRPPQNRT